jgi:hypothetical protein
MLAGLWRAASAWCDAKVGRRLPGVDRNSEGDSDFRRLTQAWRRRFRDAARLGADYDAYGVIQGGSPGSLGDINGAVLNFRKALATDGAMLKVNPIGEDAKRAIEGNCIHRTNRT